MSGNINITAVQPAAVDVVTIQLPGAPGPRGLQGIPGPSAILTIGSVTTGAAGSNASATISGVSPNQTLNLTIPRGNTGATGPANTLTIGTVNTVDALTGGSATITGTAPNQVLNLVMPRGYGVIPGGTTGQVLAKNSNNDYDTAWETPSSAPTPGNLVLRDVSGRAQVADPSANADIATKNYVDNTAGTSGNTASALVRRDSNKAIAVSTITGLTTPATTDSATPKSYVDTGDTTTLNSARRVLTNQQSATAYTFALTDEGKVVYYNVDNTPVAYTIPTNATVAFPTGSFIDIYQGASGAVTIAGAAGVTLRGPDGTAAVTLRGTYSKCRITKSNTDTWQVVGDIQTVSTQATTNATASPTAGSLVKRDVNGRAQVVDPSVAADIATKNYVDGVTKTSAQISDATAAPTASKVLIRDASAGAALAYLDTAYSVAPAAPATGNGRLYIDTTTRSISQLSNGGTIFTNRKHLGSGTAFPTTFLATGDTFLRTDTAFGTGLLFTYDGTSWRAEEDFSVADVATRNTIPTAVLYNGFRVWIAAQNQYHTYDKTNSRWVGSQAIEYRINNWIGSSIAGTSWVDLWSGTIPDPGFLYTLRGSWRQEIRMTNGTGRLNCRMMNNTDSQQICYNYLDNWMTNNAVWNFFNINFTSNESLVAYTGSKVIKGQAACSTTTDTAQATNYSWVVSAEVVPVTQAPVSLLS